MKKLNEKDSKIVEDYKNGEILMGKLSEVIDKLKAVEHRTKDIIPVAYEVYNRIFYEFVQPFYKRFK